MRTLFLAAASLVFSFAVSPVSACPDQESSVPLVSRIEFSGLRRISAETLRAHISSRVGQPLDRAKIEADVRALDRLEWFDAISVETYLAADPGEEKRAPGLRIVFRMEESSFLAGVEFRGSRALARDRIQAMLNERRIALPVAKPVRRADLWHAARIIEHSLADLGYAEARVRVRLEAVPTAAARAIFEIEDGPRIPAGRVTFSGVHAFPESSLRRTMKGVAPGAHFASLRGKNIYTPERLAEDLDRLEQFCRDHGYPQARIGRPEIQLRQEPVHQGFLWLRRRPAPRFQISIPVDQGAPYRFGSVGIEGLALSPNLKERVDALPEIRALESGGLFSQEKLERARESVTQVLSRTATREWERIAEGELTPAGAGSRVPSSSRGAPLLPEVDVALKSDSAKRTVQVTLRLREAHPYIVRRLEFSGQRRFSDRYYRRHIGLDEGDAFDPEKIETGLAQLARAGYIRPLKKQDLSVRLDETRHTADVAVRVEEIGRQKISLVGGHAGLGSTAGIVYNIFDLLGGEEFLTGHLERGPDSLQALLSVTKEAVFGTRVSLGLSVFQNIVRPNLPYAGRRRHLFTSKITGLTLATTIPVSPGDTLGLTYGITRTSTKYHLPLPPDISGIVNPALSASATSSSLGWHWSHEAAGERLAAESSVSGGWLGGTENQIRPSLDYARILPDPFSERRNTWAIRGAFAGAASFRGDLPFHDRLFAGEEYVRGFRTGELSPYAAEVSTNADGSPSIHAQSPGADLAGAINAEYRMPVAPRTEVVPFFDTGSGWLLPNWLGPHRPKLLPGTNGAWRASTGVEVRWQVPGIEQTVRVHLSLNPWRLARTFVLPDGSRFHPPDRLLALGWALNSAF